MNSRFFPSKFHQIHIYFRFPRMKFTLKSCQIVAGISTVCQFHGFFSSNCRRVFDVWPNCAPRMPLKRSRAARGVAAADFKALKTLFESRNPLRFTFYYTSQNVFFVSLTRFFSPFLLLSLTKSAFFFFLSLHSLVKCEDYLRNCRPAQKT